MSFALMMLGGAVLDLVMGWPQWLYMRIGHPVTWLGCAISALEARLNFGPHDRRIRSGAITVLVIVLIAAAPALIIQIVLPDSWVGVAIGAMLAWPLIAMRSMHEHVAAVEQPLLSGDLAAARHAVSMIVGRDPTQLDQAAVTRAAMESLAENTSDGIVAPLFWGAFLGLPGIAAYKAINTMDSMIGHRSPRYEAFGKSAARLDDVVNWPPARLTGLIFAAVSKRPFWAMKAMARDASKHRSPNAGWPESAMAAALGVRLSGPRRYEDKMSDEPWLNSGAPNPDAQDLSRALALFRRGMGLCGLALAISALL